MDDEFTRRRRGHSFQVRSTKPRLYVAKAKFTSTCPVCKRQMKADVDLVAKVVLPDNKQMWVHEGDCFKQALQDRNI